MEHRLCDGTGACAVKMPGKDAQYHAAKGNEHCAACGVFWKFREKHACGPRKPKDAASGKQAPSARSPGWKAAVAAWFSIGFELGMSGKFKSAREAWQFYVSKAAEKKAAENKL